jgi:hypothetical protein
VVELQDLQGKDKIKDYPINSLISY